MLSGAEKAKIRSQIEGIGKARAIRTNSGIWKLAEGDRGTEKEIGPGK
jgi:hypothetical protein